MKKTILYTALYLGLCSQTFSQTKTTGTTNTSAVPSSAALGSGSQKVSINKDSLTVVAYIKKLDSTNKAHISSISGDSLIRDTNFIVILKDTLARVYNPCKNLGSDTEQRNKFDSIIKFYLKSAIYTRDSLKNVKLQNDSSMSALLNELHTNKDRLAYINKLNDLIDTLNSQIKKNNSQINSYQDSIVLKTEIKKYTDTLSINSAKLLKLSTNYESNKNKLTDTIKLNILISTAVAEIDRLHSLKQTTDINAQIQKLSNSRTSALIQKQTILNTNSQLLSNISSQKKTITNLTDKIAPIQSQLNTIRSYSKNLIKLLVSLKVDSIQRRHSLKELYIFNENLNIQEDTNYWKTQKDSLTAQIKRTKTLSIKDLSKLKANITSINDTIICMKNTGELNKYDTLLNNSKKITQFTNKNNNTISNLQKKSQQLLDSIHKHYLNIINFDFNYSYSSKIIEITILAKKMNGADTNIEQLLYIPKSPQRRLVTLNSFKDIDIVLQTHIPLTDDKDEPEGSYILLKDFIYIGRYYNRNSIITPNRLPVTKPKYILERRVDDYFSAQFSTDLLGLLDNQSPNGKVQLGFSGWFDVGNRHRQFSFLQDICPSFNITKVGLSNAFIPLTKKSLDSTNYLPVSTTKIIQYENLNFGVRINIVSYISKDGGTQIFFNYRPRVFQTPFSYKDSIFKSNSLSDEYEIIAYIHYLHNRLVFVPSFSYTYFHFLDGSIPQIKNYSYTLFKGNFTSLINTLVYCPGFTVYYSPTGDRTRRLFFSANYTYRADDQSEGFMQIQFGYTMGLTEFLKSLSGASKAPVNSPSTP